jgi:glycopeptide antibiotics resistance protein
MLTASIALVIAATTMPWSTYYVGHSHWAQVEWVPFTRFVRPGDFVLNVLLFLPLGVSLSLCAATGDRTSSTVEDTLADAMRRRVRRRVLVAVVAAAMLSATVELFQVYCHGRLPATTDIFSNTLGAWLGARWAASRIANP